MLVGFCTIDLLPVSDRMISKKTAQLHNLGKNRLVL
mgnify:CR=1 FL=1